MSDSVALTLAKNLSAIMFACTGLVSVLITLVGKVISSRLTVIHDAVNSMNEADKIKVAEQAEFRRMSDVKVASLESQAALENKVIALEDKVIELQNRLLDRGM